MTLPAKFSSGSPYLGPFESMMIIGPICVPARELPRYTRNADQIIAYKPEDSDWVLKNHTFAMVVFPGSTYLPDYPENVAEAFKDNEYYNPPEYVPWAWVMN